MLAYKSSTSDITVCYTKTEDREFPKKELKYWGSEKLIPAKVTSPDRYIPVTRRAPRA